MSAAGEEVSKIVSSFTLGDDVATRLAKGLGYGYKVTASYDAARDVHSFQIEHSTMSFKMAGISPSRWLVDIPHEEVVRGMGDRARWIEDVCREMIHRLQLPQRQPSPGGWYEAGYRKDWTVPPGYIDGVRNSAESMQDLARKLRSSQQAFDSLRAFDSLSEPSAEELARDEQRAIESIKQTLKEREL